MNTCYSERKKQRRGRQRVHQLSKSCQCKTPSEAPRQKKVPQNCSYLSCVDEANSLTLPKQRLFKQKVIDALSELSDDP
jgi:hypothetical protein